MEYKPHAYQQEAFDFLIDGLQEEGCAGLFLDPGLGKTVITLSVLKHMKTIGSAERVLVVAPIRPMYGVWPAEIQKWGFDFEDVVQ